MYLYCQAHLTQCNTIQLEQQITGFKSDEIFRVLGKSMTIVS